MEKSYPDFWGRMAPTFEKRQRTITGDKMFGLIEENLTNETDLGDTLELGCGTCAFTLSIARNARSVLATDLSDSMLKEARKNAGYAGNIRFEKADCNDPPYGNASFDTVFMANLLHVVDSPKKVLDEANRMLVPCGKIILVDFTTEGMSEEDVKTMVSRYLKEFGPPPKQRKAMTMEYASDLLISSRFEITERKLIRTRQSSAIFLVAKKNG